ncbi:MAG: hypothetical protein N2170_09985, partial [Bacteroidia bacterium]|nr:hypothetical protein [Bacteroidia bacterium]
MIFLCLLSHFFSTRPYAQSVGIGTSTPHAGARLDVASSNQGVRFPSLALTAVNSWAPLLGTPANGVLVYNTATVGTPPNALTPGYYYWSGSRWVRMDATTSWSLEGNAGTNSATHFIGTIDAQSFVIRVNNQETFVFTQPGGTGSAWSIHRGGGDPRGLYAIDLQGSRDLPIEVASGNYSVLTGGRRNTASGVHSVVSGGFQNTASNEFSVISGGQLNFSSGRYSAILG